ncbi:MAG: phosphoribosylaminoimidazolesuccinocarboxamide synthase [Candidatus Omnitrophica bacterium]|nr:phosphoribosylaminoimidazolesuccinocarboxamide synthase [Candidatus Omnitrophota bacterium]
MTASGVVLETELAGAKLFKRGKVRDVYDLGDQLLIVATDRISAFDVVIPTGIPSKGAVLTQISAFWFEKMTDLTPTHLVSADTDRITQMHPVLKTHRAVLAGRSMLARKTEVVPIECVVRGYLAGSGWKEYQKSQSVCGVLLPAGLKEAQELPEPIFTPATKEESGHDINISEVEMAKRVGADLTTALRETSLAVYSRARDYARSKGIIIADTKFEFGRFNGEPMLIDELLTPDSSRFWPVEEYAPGRSPVSFDKQFVRDYLEGLSWDKTPPAPALPEEIVRKTSAKYLQALAVLTGRGLS